MGFAARHASDGIVPRGGRSWVSALKLIIVGVALVAGVNVMLPITLGGDTLYVTTSGISMEPRFHTGDLAVLRRADVYRVGDVAAYYSELNKTVVMHRIIKIQDDRHVFQGDNNSFIDYDTPTSAQLMGKLAFRVPKGGYAVHILSSGPALGIVVFLFVTSGGVAHTRRRRHHRRRAAIAAQNSLSWIPAPVRIPRPRGSDAPARPPPDPFSGSHRSVPEGTVTGALSPFAGLSDQGGPRTRNPPAAIRPVAAMVALVGCLGLGLGLAAWTRPTTVMTRIASGGAGNGTSATLDLGYQARVRPSAAYDGTEISDPQPIFRKVLERLQVSYVYHGSPGTLQVDAVLNGLNGWTSTVSLATSRPVTGRGDSGSVVLDLADFEARAAAAARAAGISAGDLEVTVTPLVVRHDGTTFDAALDLSVSPTVVKAVTAHQLDPVRDTGTGHRTGASSSIRMAITPNTVSLFGGQLTVPAARRISLGTLLFSLVAGLFVAGAIYLSPLLTEPQRIAQRYRQLLVLVGPITPSPAATIVDVPDIDSLARLATSYGLLVLHWAQDRVHTYVVQDEKTLYQFILPIAGTSGAEGPATADHVPTLRDR